MDKCDWKFLSDIRKDSVLNLVSLPHQRFHPNPDQEADHHDALVDGQQLSFFRVADVFGGGGENNSPCSHQREPYLRGQEIKILRAQYFI